MMMKCVTGGVLVLVTLFQSADASCRCSTIKVQVTINSTGTDVKTTKTEADLNVTTPKLTTSSGDVKYLLLRPKSTGSVTGWFSREIGAAFLDRKGEVFWVTPVPMSVQWDEGATAREKCQKHNKAHSNIVRNMWTKATQRTPSELNRLRVKSGEPLAIRRSAWQRSTGIMKVNLSYEDPNIQKGAAHFRVNLDKEKRTLYPINGSWRKDLKFRPHGYEMPTNNAYPFLDVAEKKIFWVISNAEVVKQLWSDATPKVGPTHFKGDHKRRRRLTSAEVLRKLHLL